MALFDQITKAAQSPLAQGLLGAAAFGFNPALGLLAAPGLANDRRRMEQDRSAADLALEAEAEALAESRARRKAASQIPRLMASAPPGLLNMEGGVDTPGQDQFQQRALGLLTQVAPQATAQGLLGQVFQQPQKPSGLQERLALFQRTLGRPPTESEALSLFGAGGNIQDLLARVELEDRLSDRERRTEAETEQQQLDQISTEGLVDTGRTVFENLDRLEGTFLEPGGALMGGRRTLSSLLGEGAGMLGFDEFSESRQGEIEALDKLKKDTSDFVVNLAQATGANSATELNQIRDSFAGLESSPAAIRAATRREVERAIQRADARGIEIPNREGLEALVNGGQGESRQLRFDPETGEVVPR